MESSDARRLKALASENQKLKKLLAELVMDNATLRELLAKSSKARRKERRRELGDRREELFSSAARAA